MVRERHWLQVRQLCSKGLLRILATGTISIVAACAVIIVLWQRSLHQPSLCYNSAKCRSKFANWSIAETPGFTYCHTERNGELPQMHFCEQKQSQELAVVIFSDVLNYELRNSIRNTWAKQPSERQRFAVFFFVTILLGSADKLFEPTHQKAVSEAQQHGDMILNRVRGDRLHSAHHTMALYEFVSRCKSLHKSDYLLKLQDNTFVNTELLIKLIESLKLSADQHFILGDLVVNESVVKVPTVQRYLPNDVFPLTAYPRFVKTVAYLIPMRTVVYLYTEALCVRLLYLDEVILNGYLAQKLDVQLVHSDSFVFSDVPNADVNANRPFRRFDLPVDLVKFWKAIKHKI